MAVSNGTDISSSATVSLAQSSKHIIQIVQLLEERRMSFSFCLNRGEVLLLAGFGLLHQMIGLDQKGKLIQDSQRLLCAVISMLERGSAIGSSDFKRIACAVMSVDHGSQNARPLQESGARRKTGATMPAPKNLHNSARKPSAISRGGHPRIKQEHAAGSPSVISHAWIDSSGPNNGRTSSQHSLSSAFSDPMSRSTFSEASTSTQGTSQTIQTDPPNLDYFDFTNESGTGVGYASHAHGRKLHKVDFRDSIGANAHAPPAPFIDGVFPSPDVFSPQVSTASPGNLEWTSDLWSMPSDMYTQPISTQRAPDASETGEELATSELVGNFSGINMNREVGADGAGQVFDV